MNFLHLFLFSIYHAQQSAVDGHQMYFGDLDVGKASTIGREIPPSSPNFHRRGSKTAKFGVVFNIIQI